MPIQFERVGYFVADAVDSRPGAPVFNRTVTLKDAWARIEKKQGSVSRSYVFHRCSSHMVRVDSCDLQS